MDLVARVRCKARIFCLLVLICGALGQSVLAQESEKTWRIADPGGQSAVYKTQQEAVEAIKDLEAPSPYEGAYEYVDQIKKTAVSENGDVAITYWMGVQQPSDPDWAYRSPTSQQPYASEQEAVAQHIQFLNSQNPACPTGATLTPTGDWEPQLPDYPEYAEKLQIRHYATTIVIGNNTQDSPCRTADFGDSPLSRMRRFGCPKPYTDWMDEYQGCANDAITATISSKTEECQANAGTGVAAPLAAAGLVGNPCNVKTGDKYQLERDFDLGWIALTRYYHSVIATNTGGFGPGWSHSHSDRLMINGGSIGLIQGSGYQVRFRASGGAYSAANGSGDRLVNASGKWVLYRQDRVLVFDASGNLLERRNEDGTSLTYAYDPRGRLASITHSTGRSIQFEYDDSSKDALISSVRSNGIQLVSYAYSQNRQVETVTYYAGQARTYHYEDSRFPLHLTGVTTEDGVRYSTFAYDNKGRVISSQHAGGADGVTLLYTSQGGAIVTDALGHETNYSLTTGGASRKVSGTADSAGSVSYIYDDESQDFRGRLNAVIDKKQSQTKYTYSEAFDAEFGEQVSVQTIVEAKGSPQERTSKIKRSIASNRLVGSQIGSLAVRYTRNSRLQFASITATDTSLGKTRSRSYSYCEQADVIAGTCPLIGMVTKVDGPRTDVVDVTTYTYYPSDDATCASAPATCPHRMGDLWLVQDAVGNITETLKYDGAGRVLSVKDANNVVTDFEYAPRGWLTARKVRGTDNSSEADDQITRIDYYPNGLVQKATLPDGSFTTYTYDAAHRLTDITDGEGNTIHYTLDNAGNRTKEETKGTTGTVLRTLSRVYNQLGQLQTHKDAYDHGTGYVYDSNGNTDKVTDALNRVTDNDYDPLNRLSKTIQNLGGLNVTTQFQYDAHDNLTAFIDPKGLTTGYAYNGLGDLTQLSSPDTGITAYTYDSAGNRKTQTDARNVTATYSYDALNRLTSVSYPDSSLNVGYSYDTVATTCATGETFAAGRLSRITDGSGSTQYCYDRFGQLVRKVQTTAGQSFTVRYGYTKAGQLSAVTYPDGTVADYVRDAQGRTTEVGVTRPGKAREVLLTAASYYPFGPAAEWVFGNGRLFQRTLNQNYQPGVVQDQSAGGLSLGYEFDAVGNLVKLRNGNQSEPPLRRYMYDALNRLAETRDGTTDALLQVYSYDATGNRLSATDAGVTTAYTLAANSHRLADVGGLARGYDAAGNTIRIDAYNGGGEEPPPPGDPGPGDPPPGDTESFGAAATQTVMSTATSPAVREFVYNDANRMQAAKRNGIVAMSYVYNGRGEQVRRVNGTDAAVTLYDEAGHWLGEYNNAGAPAQQVVWLDDLPVGLIVGAVAANQPLHYIEADALGSPRAVINGLRNVKVWSWDLTGEAFGKAIPNEDADSDGASLSFNLRFPGQRYDTASGLNYNYFRDYDSSIGRYVESDPIGLNGGISTYSYVGGRPTLYGDRWGLDITVVINGNVALGDPMSWKGKHSGLYIEHGWDKGSVIVDPHGSYWEHLGREPGFIHEGADANLQDYLEYQRTDGPNVRTYTFATTPEQENEVLERLNGEYGDGLTCANGVSALLDGIGPFKGLGTYLTPDGLEEALQRLKGQYSPNPFIPNPFLPDPYK